jgi:predicted RNase H-like HicB family nuclease
MLYFDEMGKPRMKFDCVLVREGNAYSALCLNLDISSIGDSPAKTKRALKEAVELYLAGATEANRSYMRPVPKNDDPRTKNPETVVASFTLGVDNPLK